mmetsp:Transcript_25851/g.73045  ORF Transcript_25851/g.73045 Transcript_25851/m.73045 type:complete len:215 (-) Transcript_25851:555-1199(-)
MAGFRLNMRCRTQGIMETRRRLRLARLSAAWVSTHPGSPPGPLRKKEALAAFTQPPMNGTKRGEARGPPLPSGGLRTKASSGDWRQPRSRSDARDRSSARTSCSVRGRIPGRSAAPPTRTMLRSRSRTSSSSHGSRPSTCSAQATMSSGSVAPLMFSWQPWSKNASGTRTSSFTSSSVAPPLTGTGTVTPCSVAAPPLASQSGSRMPCGGGGAT